MRCIYLAVLCGLYGVLSGCSTFKQADTVSNQVVYDQQQGEQRLRQLRHSSQRLRVHDEPWVEHKALKVAHAKLPEMFNKDISFASGEPLSIQEFSQFIHKLCAIPVRVTPDAHHFLARKSGKPEGQGSAEQQIVGIRWQGKLEGLLDTVASSLGLSWKYSQQAIQLYYLDSRTFQIYAIPSATEMSSTVHSGIDVGLGGDGASQGSSQSAQSTSVSMKSNMVKDIQKSIRALLTPKLGHLSLSSSTGSITVIDTPEALDRIEQYVQHENKLITKQVLLNIKLLSVELNDSEQLGIDWKIIAHYKSIGGPLLESVMIAHQGDGTNNFTLKGGNHLQQSQLLLQALSKQGKVSVVTSPSVTTLNLQPVPVQVATQKSYLARIDKTTNDKGITDVALTPGMITHGFNMNLLPFIMSNNQLLLQYAINLNELIGLQEFGNDENKLQLPEINSRLFSQKVKLKSGDTLILSGFEKTHNKAEHQGVGGARNWLLGGSVKAHKTRNIIVLMITPLVLE